MITSRMLSRVSLVAVLVAAFGAVAFTTSQTESVATSPPGGGQQEKSAAQLATIKQYCGGCHNDRMKAAGVSFDGLTADGVGRHADVFEKAVRKLRGRVM